MTESSLPDSQEPENAFTPQYQRVFEAACCVTQVELAEFLGIRQSSISDAKRRQAIPAEWLIKLYDKKRINPEWIRTGTGGKLVQAVPLEDGQAEMPRPQIRAHTVKRVPARDCTTEELITELVRRALKNIERQEPAHE